MNKRILSLVLALVMVLGTFGTVFAASYDDVTGTEFATAVDRLSTLGILEGYPDGTFKPANTITRAEFAAVVARAKGLEAVAVAAKGLPTGFTDVPTTHWASGYVGTAARLGIVNGIGWGQFAPEAPVKYEEAVTMIVRALGYEAAAQAKGGYPYGYLIVANDNGLLDEVKGTQGVAATRGLVAQLTDNALEIPMMVQVGFGSEAKWVVSGTTEHGGDEIYLLDELGFDSIEGRVVTVNTKTDKITVEPTDEDLKNVTLEVAEGFDFYAVEGLETKFWSKDDKVEVYVVNEEAKFDAVEVDGDELTLIVEDENYEVAKDATLTVDGDSVDQDEFIADYAKVVLNDDNEIIWAQGYGLDGFILVEEVKELVAYSYDGYDEVDLEDFTVIKEGKTIAIDAIEEQDVLFFNADEEFAVVYNKGTEGQLDRVYTDKTFRFEGAAYSYSELVPVFFDEGKVGELEEAILADFLDEEATITVFVDFAGKAVVVSGEVSSAGNSAYGVLLSNAQPFTGRKGDMIALDLRNGANEKVSYDIEVADIDDLGDFEIADLVEDVVLKVTVDKDGDITAIELPEVAEGVAESFDIDDANVKVGNVSYRLQASTIVFHDGNDEATTLGNAKDLFSEVKAEATIYVEKGRVVAVVGETDADADTKDVTGLVTGVKALTNDQLQFTVSVFGVTQRLVTESKTLGLTENTTNYDDQIVTFKVGETSGEIKDVADAIAVATHRTLTVSSISGRVITPNPTTDTKVELNSNAVIYDDELETMNLRDLKATDSITVYFEGSSNRFVDYVVVGGAALPPVGTSTGVVTYKNALATAFSVDGEIYTTNANTVVKNAAGAVIGLGDASILKYGDVVDVKDNVITVKVSVVAEAAAFDALFAGTTFTGTQAQVTAARTAYEKLNSYGKALVTEANVDELVEAEDILAAAAVGVLINAFTGTGTQAQVTAARTAYDVLTPAAKLLVDGFAVNSTAKLVLGENTLAVASVDAKLTALEAEANVTLADKADIVLARAEFNTLTVTQVGLLTAGNAAKLVAAEKAITDLELAKVDVDAAKTALILAITSGNEIVLPTTATETYTLAFATTTGVTGTGTVANPVVIVKQAASFTVDVTVTMTAVQDATTAVDETTVNATKVFTVTVPHLAAPITVVAK